MNEYDQIADWYASDRGRTIGVREALDALSSLPRGARVLDAGCGNGIPIFAALLDAGYSAVGLDSSGEMLRHFRRNFPKALAVRSDVRNCPFEDATFDAAVSWGMLFHLPRAEQARALASLSRVLKPGGILHFTGAEIVDIPDPDPGITGTMNGVTFRYFAVASYRDLLAPYGLELIESYVGPGDNSYFTARKTGESRPPGT